MIEYVESGVLYSMRRKLIYSYTSGASEYLGIKKISNYTYIPVFSWNF